MSSLPPAQNTFIPPLPYATPVARRPGMMSAIGIISIVIGSLSTLMSLGGVASGCMYLVMSRMSWPTPTVVTTTAGPVGTPVAPTTMPVGSWSSSSYVTITSSGTTTTTSSATTTGGFPFKIDPGASILTIVENVLSLGVAILLIVAGSLLMKNSIHARRLHRLYVILKLPLIAAATVATWWTYTSMMNTFGAMGTARPMPGFAGMMAGVQATMYAVFSLAYPITLSILLSTRAAKDYFAQVAAGYYK